MSRLVALLACLALSLFPSTDSFSDILYCTMTATSPSGVLFTCPGGDGDRLDDGGLTVTVTLHDIIDPVGIPTDYIWLESCSGSLVPCGNGGKIHASAATDANGQTTITGRFVGGGCDNTGVQVFVNIPIEGPIPGAIICESVCLPISVRSCDLNGDLVVNLIDLSNFGLAYPSPPKPYNDCTDYTAPFGTITLADFAKYGVHSSHHC